MKDNRIPPMGFDIDNASARLAQPVGKAFTADEYSLFSYRDNTAALGCYLSMGFVIHDYPEDAPMADDCYYLVRPL